MTVTPQPKPQSFIDSGPAPVAPVVPPLADNAATQQAGTGRASSVRAEDEVTRLIRHLAGRVGAAHIRQRLGLEDDHHQQEVFRPSGKFFHLENWYSIHGLIRGCFRLAGLHGRGRRNALDIRLQRNPVTLPDLPAAFSGLRILHLSDLHADMSPEVAHALIARLREVDYDLCVMTGDYRARTFGGIEAAIDALAAIRLHLKDPVYAVLGNHDSIHMVEPMEAAGMRVLMNESVAIERSGHHLYLAGVDDAHYFRLDNLEKAMAEIPESAVKILLSHTPEIYRQAACAGFDLFLCGHTHGGQICLPGGFPLTLDARVPRALGRGIWRYRSMQGYTSTGSGTSIVDIRLNCPPEITLHTLLPEA